MSSPDFIPHENGAVVDLVDSLENGQTIDYGLLAVHAEDAWKRTRGEGIVVAVIDTGWVDHPDLNDNVVNRSIPALSGTFGNGADTNGHGTHVSGIIAAIDNNMGIVGVAPGCHLHVYQAIPAGPDYVAAAVNQAVADGCDIISMSLGGTEDDPNLGAAVKAAYDAGVVMVAAAGNNPAGFFSYPALYQQVIAVSALDEHLDRATFAPLVPNHVALPGVNVLSTWLGGGYARLSGTSQATPLLAGIIALLLSLYKPTKDVVHATVQEQLSRIAANSADLLYREPDLDKL